MTLALARLQTGWQAHVHPLMLGGLAAALLLVMGVALCVGPMPIDGAALLKLLGHKLGFVAAGASPVQDAVMFSIRLPRVLLAAAVGAILGASGSALQGLFRNPLADPALLGVSSGAALGAAVWIVFGTALTALLPWLALGGYARAVAAFAGGVAATFVIFRLSGRQGRTSVATLLLAGIAINALGGAALGLLTYLSSDRELRDLTYWLLGSFGGATWHACWLLLPAAVVLCVVFSRHAGVLNIFMLGENEAHYLGVHVQRLKTVLVLVVALGVGLSVAFTGMISFIGLVTPHLLRLSGGPDHRLVIPGAALLGALLCVGADAIARTLVSPAELPVGILTALIGAPFFMWLLVRQRRLEF
ncbi:MAG TPA: iron ABC transporter permease [Gammaproteobacteria bacterium]|nr:iron ABC transporter permease [Gammaproteobacteria bacterium]